jgi:thiol-disulfide isomerase/thioredoxin
MPLPIGTPAPPIPGQPRGARVVAFYKVTCPTCQMAAPRLSEFERAFPGRAVAVGQDPAERLEAFDRSFGLGLPAVADTAPYELSDAYGIRTVPTVFVIDDADAVADVVEAWDRDGLNRAAAAMAELVGADPVTISEPGDGLPAFRPG